MVFCNLKIITGNMIATFLFKAQGKDSRIQRDTRQYLERKSKLAVHRKSKTEKTKSVKWMKEHTKSASK